MLRIWEHADFSGQKWDFEKSHSNLFIYPSPSLAIGRFASAIEVIGRDETEAWVLWSDIKYKGSQIGPLKAGDRITKLSRYGFNDKLGSIERVYPDYDPDAEGVDDGEDDDEFSFLEFWEKWKFYILGGAALLLVIIIIFLTRKGGS